VLETIWAILVKRCDELRDVDWKWQAGDSRLSKARFGGAISARIPRIVRKTAPNKASWSMAKGSARRDDGSGQLARRDWRGRLLHAVVVDRPDAEEHLCLDKGYGNPTGHEISKSSATLRTFKPSGQTSLAAAADENLAVGLSKEPWPGRVNAVRFLFATTRIP